MTTLKDWGFGFMFGAFIVLAGCENDCFLMWPNWLAVGGLFIIAILAEKSRHAPGRK